MANLVGKTLAHYQILSELGRGGMATVYKAWDTVTTRHVAVKVLLPLLASDLEFVERFHREAKAAQRLNHPNIVRIYEASQHGETHYLVMDYVEGESLAHRLAREKRLSVDAATSIVNQIGAALDHAHAQGIVHRDVKPSNILLNDAGQAFLSDFGIAKAVAGTKLTRTGTSLGTPEYMSPEQVLGKTIDGRSDLYALGVVLYEMLTGQVPFTADTQAAILYRHVYTPPPMLSMLNVRLPAWMNAVVQKALAKDPQERFQSGHEFALAMRGGESAATQVVDRPRFQPKKPIAIALSVVGVVALVLLIVFAMMPKGESSQVAMPGGTPGSATIVGIPPTARGASSTPAPTLASAFTPTRTSTPRPTDTPRPTNTPFPTSVPESLFVHAAEEGTRFAAKTSGIYRFAIASGAIQNCPPGADPTNRNCATWTTHLMIFRNKEITWSPASSPRGPILAPSGWDYVLGNKSPIATSADAEKSGLGMFVDIPLAQGNYVVLVADDCQGCYGDNQGGITLSASIVAALPTPTATSIPTRTPTLPPPASQAREFAEPILAAIANKPPTWNDDFGDPGSGWLIGSSERGNWGYKDGAYAIVANHKKYVKDQHCCDSYSERMPPFSDFVLEVEGTFVSGESGQWGVILRDKEQPSFAEPNWGHYGLMFDVRGFHMFRYLNNGDANLGDSIPSFYKRGYVMNRLQVIAQGPRIAIYLNGEPLWFVTDSSLSKGLIRLRGMSSADTPLRVQFDNLKVWDISNLSFP